MQSTRVGRRMRASRSAIYRALLDPVAIERWRVPTDLRCEVHEFDPREGGAFRISLTYEDPDREGKSGSNTDTYHGRFVELVPAEKVVELIEFETADPAFQGEMTMTTLLTDVDGGTEVVIAHEGIPSGVAPEDNETGTRMALANLAALVEVEAPPLGR